MTATAKKLSIRLEAVGGDKVRSEFKTLGAIGKNISKGEGLSPLLEQRYGLNPAYGSYR